MDLESISNEFYISDGDLNAIQDIFLSENEIFLEGLERETASVAYSHFFNPVLPAKQLMEQIGISKDELVSIYSWLANSEIFQTVITSDYYPFAMMMRYSKNLLDDLIMNPNYFDKIVTGQTVSPKRLEVHATYANCNLFCDMCLWRAGQDDLEYTAEELEGGILSVDQWNQMLEEAKSLGTQIVIFSGGGEPQLREESHKVLRFAREQGQKILVYTNGTILTRLADNMSPLYQEFLQSDWLRVSLHAATNNTYSKLVGLPESRDNIQVVTNGIERLIRDRDGRGTNLKIGMNMVIQVSNYHEIADYMEMANELGVDFVNLRVDCVNVTRDLDANEKTIMYDQLRKIRSDYAAGKYGNLFVDFADVLIAPMNGWDRGFSLRPTPECRVHQYRAAVNPFGRVAVCDLMAEPHYSCGDFTLGFLGDNSYSEIMAANAGRVFPGDQCNVCMPGQISINSVYHKILEDTQIGITPKYQFFVRPKWIQIPE